MRVLDRARLAAQTDADILVEAESGTGKELLARFIHEASSRREKPFIAINCAAVPEQLLESELFGHVRGAFTGATLAKAGKFELANGGTLLLDEIGEMPLELQPKLLRVLQEREVERLGDTRTIPVNIRIIATTNVSLQEMVEQGRFRADLYYRLNVIPLTLPPLRERPEDIPVLAEYFAAKFAKQAGRPAPELHPEFLAGLQKHTWPGNARELSNFMRRVVAMSNDGNIGPEHLAAEFSRPAAVKSVPRPQPGAGGNSHARTRAPTAGDNFATYRRQPHPRGRDAGNQPAHDSQQDSRIRLAATEVCLMSSTPIIQFLERFLNVTSDRQSLVVNNMANIDTPGYRTRDVNFRARAGPGRGISPGGKYGSGRPQSYRDCCSVPMETT